MRAHVGPVKRASAIEHGDARGARGPVFVARLGGNQTSCAHAPVTHDYAVVTFQMGGSSAIEQRGRWSIARGDVVLVPAGEPHRMLRAEGSQLWGVGFCVSCLAAEGSAALLEPFERVRAGGSAVVHVPEPRHAFLETVFAELEAACRRTDENAYAIQRSLLTLVLDEVARASSPNEAAAGTLVSECLRIIERRCLEPLTLEELARAVHRSAAHVTTALRKATGRTAHAWIVAGRMAEARRRLLHSDEHVEIIAERVGYGDPTSFIRTFRREHGATPAAWRAANRPSP
jgi:AraC-like DNA-binding protein